MLNDLPTDPWGEPFFLSTVQQGTAQAACNGPETIYVQRPNVAAGTGVITTNKIRDVALEECTQSWRASAAIVAQTFDNRVEIGWVAERVGFVVVTNPYYYWEIEGVANGPFYEPYAPPDVYWSRFKIYTPVSAGAWKFFFDYEGDGSYAEIGPVVATAWAGGAVMTSTERAGTAASAYDVHTSLDYRSSVGIWYSWTSQSASGSITNYAYNKTSGDRYEIRHV